MKQPELTRVERQAAYLAIGKVILEGALEDLAAQRAQEAAEANPEPRDQPDEPVQPAHQFPSSSMSDSPAANSQES